MNHSTRHHVIPRSVGGVSCEENIILVEEEKHRSYHTIFSNRCLCLEDCQRILATEYQFDTETKRNAMGILFPNCSTLYQCYKILETEWWYKKGLMKKHRTA